MSETAAVPRAHSRDGFKRVLELPGVYALFDELINPTNDRQVSLDRSETGAYAEGMRGLAEGSFAKCSDRPAPISCAFPAHTSSCTAWKHEPGTIAADLVGRRDGGGQSSRGRGRLLVRERERVASRMTQRATRTASKSRTSRFGFGIAMRACSPPCAAFRRVDQSSTSAAAMASFHARSKTPAFRLCSSNRHDRCTECAGRADLPAVVCATLASGGFRARAWTPWGSSMCSNISPTITLSCASCTVA